MPVSKDYVTDYSADSTGASDCVPALASFGTFAQAQGSDPVTLTIPAGTFKHDGTGGSGFGAQFFAKGVDNLTVQGAGVGSTTFEIPQSNSWAPPFFGSLAQQTAADTAARVETVSAGATTLVCMTPSDADFFPAGRWGCLAGVDLQGVIDGNYGFPTNNHFFDFFKIVSSDGGTGVITIDRPLEDSYKSTWAVQYDGSSGNPPQGGAATLYLMDSSYEQATVVDGITFDLPDASTPWVYFANNTDLTLRNCVFTGTSGPCPSQNYVTRWENLDLTNAVIEVDKLVRNWYIDNVTHQTNPSNSKFFFQSSSIKNLYITNSDLNWLAGVARNTSIDNSIVDKLWFANGYGMARWASVTNSTVGEFIGGSSSNPVTNFPMTSGVIRTRRKMLVSGMTISPGGKVRLTVDSTVDVGSYTYNYSGIFTNLTGQSTVTVVDGTTIDLDSVSATTGAGGSAPIWTGGGSLNGAALPWAIPGYYCNMMSSTNGVGVVGNFRVLDQWNDDDYIYVQTSLSGDWPSNVSTFGTHPCKQFVGTNNTGCVEIIEHSRSAAQNKPIYSHIYREYDKNWGTSTSQARPQVWGAIQSIKVDVVTPYSGVGALTWKLSGFDNWQMTRADLSVISLALSVNAKEPGLREITPSGNTGAKSGDSLPTLAAGDRLGGTSLSSPILSADVSGESNGPVITLEVTTDQGILVDATSHGRLVWRRVR